MPGSRPGSVESREPTVSFPTEVTVAQVLAFETEKIRSEVDVRPDLLAEDSMQEAQLVDMRFDMLRNQLAILVDLRQSAYVDVENFGLIIFMEVHTLSVDGLKAISRPRARVILGSLFEWSKNACCATFDVWDAGNADIQVRANEAMVIVGDAVDVRGAPPEYQSSTRQQIAAGTQSWESRVELYSWAEIRATDE